MSEKTTRCTDCAAEFTEAELCDAEGEPVPACPTCGATNVPCAIADDVTLRINWHELRILGIWATNYAEQYAKKPDTCGGRMLRTLRAILARLHAQHPERAPLTLADELKQLATVGNLEIRRSDGSVEKIPQRKPD